MQVPYILKKRPCQRWNFIVCSVAGPAKGLNGLIVVMIYSTCTVTSFEYLGTCSEFINCKRRPSGGSKFDVAGEGEVVGVRWGDPSRGSRTPETGDEWPDGEPTMYGFSVSGGRSVDGLRGSGSIDGFCTPATTLIEDSLLRSPRILGGLSGACAWEATEEALVELFLRST